MKRNIGFTTVLAVCFLVLLIAVPTILANIFYNPEPVYTDLQIVQMHSLGHWGNCYFITKLPSAIDYTTGKESDCLSTVVAIHISIEEAAEKIREFLK